MSGPSTPKPSKQDGETSNPLSTISTIQLRAFLGAAEDVEADSDTMEDLLDVLGDEITEPDSDGETSSDTEDLSLLVHEHNMSLARVSSAEPDNSDLDPEIIALGEEAQQAWTEDEVRKMMHHVKERGMSSFIREYVFVQNIPVVKLLFAFGISLCPEFRAKRPKTLLYLLKVAISRELHLRERLPQYNTIADAVTLIGSSKRIMVLSGAGISVSCGIPDFRSHNGLYATLKQRGHYDLDDPQQMFDIHYFKENPKVFYSFASQIYPSNFIPSPCHRFIKLLEDKNKLLRNYTQNIDTLESIAGITRVLQCHGSFKTATCLQCRIKVPGIEIENDILDQRVPYCKVCSETYKAEARKSRSVKKKGKRRKEWEGDSDESDDLVGVMKPDITFFGEKLTDDFDQALLDDRDKVDLLLVIGTSLKVSPVSEILSHLPHSVPQILINKTPIKHINPDIVLLGDADEIVHHLCDCLRWDLPPPPNGELTRPRTNGKRTSSNTVGRAKPTRVRGSHVWLFNGAEGGKWVEDIKERCSDDTNGVTQPKGPQEPQVKRARLR